MLDSLHSRYIGCMVEYLVELLQYVAGKSKHSVAHKLY